MNIKQLERIVTDIKITAEETLKLDNVAQFACAKEVSLSF